MQSLASAQDRHVIGGIHPLFERIEFKTTAQELCGRDRGSTACLGDCHGLADTLGKLERQIVRTACIADVVQVNILAAFGQLLKHVIRGQEVLVALNLDRIEQVDDVLGHCILKLLVPTLELLCSHHQVEFLLKLHAIAKATGTLEHVLMIQSQEYRLNIQTNIIQLLDCHTKHPLSLDNCYGTPFAAARHYKGVKRQGALSIAH